MAYNTRMVIYTDTLMNYLYFIGISRIDYYKARKRLITLDFVCQRCQETDDTSAEAENVCGPLFGRGRRGVRYIRHWQRFVLIIMVNMLLLNQLVCLSGKAGRGPVTMHVLLRLLSREASLVNLQMQLVSEAALGRHRREVYVAMDSRIWLLWDQYDDHDIVCEEFLKEIAIAFIAK